MDSEHKFTIDMHGDVGCRNTMEDRFLNGNFELSDGSIGNVFGICDGHNGSNVVNMVIERLIFYIKKGLSVFTFEEFDTNELFTNACKRIFKLIDFEIAQKYDDDPCEYQGGTTVSCIILCKTTCYLVNLGDTRCVVLTDNFNVQATTIDHKPNNVINHIINQSGIIISGITTRRKLDSNGELIPVKCVIDRVTKFTKSYTRVLMRYTKEYTLPDTHGALLDYLSSGHVVIAGKFDQCDEMSYRTTDNLPHFMLQTLLSSAFGVARALGNFNVHALKKIPYFIDNNNLTSQNVISEIPDITKVQISPDKSTIFYIASDGYWDVLSIDYLTEFLKIKFKGTVNGLAQSMVKDAIDNGSEDNVSCMIAMINNLE